MSKRRKYTLLILPLLLLIALGASLFVLARVKSERYRTAIVQNNSMTRDLVGIWQSDQGTLLILNSNGTGYFKSAGGQMPIDWSESELELTSMSPESQVVRYFRITQ